MSRLLYIWANIKIAFKELRGNKLRTFLTTLGVLIGIFAVVGMGMMAYSLQKSLMGQFTQMGSNVFWVQKFPRVMMFGGGDVDWRKIQRWPDIKIEYVDLIRENAPAVKSIAPITYKRTRIKSEKEQTNSGLVIATNRFLNEVSGYELNRGRFLVRKDVKNKRYVCVISKKILETLFPFNPDPVGKTINVNNRPFKIIGTLKERSGRLGRGRSNFIIIPYTIAKSMFSRTYRLRLTIEAFEGRIQEAKDQAITQLRLARGLKWDEENNFSITTTEQMVNAMNKVASLGYIVIIGITAISLIVAGIGIMNVMYVTVTERTKEIGIRKACGATQKDILWQFGIESALVSLLGGVFAIILVYVTKFFLAQLVPFDLFLPNWIIFLGILFSIMIGLVFGVFPAYKASKKDPVESLRYE